MVPQSPQYRQRADDYIRGRDTVHACLAQLSDCHPEMRRHGALMKRGAELCIHLLSSNHTHETRGLDLHTPTAHNLSTKPLLLNVNLTHQDGSYFLCLSVSLSLCAALWWYHLNRLFLMLTEWKKNILTKCHWFRTDTVKAVIVSGLLQNLIFSTF